MTRRLGFIGTGAITAAIVRGLRQSDLRDWPVVLSPRSAEISAALAGSLAGVSIAASNQDVVDQADVIVLAVRPQDAEAVIRPLRFDPAQPIISLIAALDIADIQAWTGASNVTRAIPLPFVERRSCATPIMPPNETAAQIFRALGDCIQVSDLKTFDCYGAASALMSTYFGVAEAAQQWLVGQGLPAEDATLYLRNLFGSLGATLRTAPLSLAELRDAHTTRGGLNELAHKTFMAQGGGAALADGLTAVLARIRGHRDGKV